MMDKVLGGLCLLVLCGILVAGLWPFRAPKNEVDWPVDRDGLIFGDHGSILSSRDFEITGSPDGPCSLEIWVQPREIDSWGTILAFYSPEHHAGLALRQSWDDIVLLLKRSDQELHGRTLRIYLGNVFHREKPVLVTISSGGGGTAIYTDGALANMSSHFRIASGDLTGQLIIGNSPVKPDSWSGELKGIAIYHRELTATEVAQHYEDWTKKERSDSSKSDGAVALYLFNEGHGRLVHNQIDPATDLLVPEHFFVLHQQFLQTPWDEFRPGWSYWRNVGVNIVGFVPLGFVLYAYFSSVRRTKQAVVVTIALGFAVSLTIEVLQAFLPTRDSGMTDLITNTSGTALGAILCARIAPHNWCGRVGIGIRSSIGENIFSWLSS